MTTKRIPTTEVVPGDVVSFMGKTHRITSTDQVNGFGDRIIRADTGWGMATDPNTKIEVHR